MGVFAPVEEVGQRLSVLGHRIRVARVRRGLSIAALAAKIGVNRNTLNALELGKPGVALTVLVSALWALGLDQTLEGVADPNADSHGATLEAARRPKRVRAMRREDDDYDF